MTQMICGMCSFDRGMFVPITVLIGEERGQARKKITLCSFCDEERWPGATHTRVHAWPDKPETVVNIPHIIVVADES